MGVLPRGHLGGLLDEGLVGHALGQGLLRDKAHRQRSTGVQACVLRSTVERLTQGLAHGPPGQDLCAPGLEGLEPGRLPIDREEGLGDHGGVSKVG